MASITIKNIPEPLLQKIKESSAANCRSMNAEIIFCLQQVLTSTQRQTLSLEQIRTLRAKTKDYYLTSAELETTVEDGRV